MATIVKVPSTRSNGPKKIRWRALIRCRGVVESQTFDTKAEARDWAIKTEATIKVAADELHGLAPATTAVAVEVPGSMRLATLKEEVALAKGEHVGSRHTTLAVLMERYEQQVIAHMAPKAAAAARRQLGWWARELAKQAGGRGPLTLARIMPSHIVRAREVLEAETFARSPKAGAMHYERTPASCNRYCASLGALFSKAIEWQLIERHPMRGSLKRRPEDNKRQRFLSDDERTQLLDACKRSDWPPLHTLVLLALTTGARRGELLGLRWSDVDLKAGRASLRTSKNKDPRTLALTGRALEELRALRLQGGAKTEYVFPSPSGTGGAYWGFDSHFRAALRDAGIDGARFHDLRHSCASYLAAGGASLLEIGRVLGHRSTQTTARYAHLTDAHGHALVEQMAKRKGL